MKSMRMALLAAVALAVMPAAAYADMRERPDHGDHGDRGRAGDGDHARPAPVQASRAPRGSGMMASHGIPDSRPTPAAQFRRDDIGRWQGGGRGPGAGWQGRGDAQIARPQPVSGLADNRPDRGQWRHNADRHNGRNDGRSDNGHRSDGDRGQWTGSDHRANPGNDSRRWDADNRGQWNGGRRSDNGSHGQWTNGDRRWNNNGDHRWDSRPGGNNHHWDSGRWRNDHRYDWRGWRSSHHNLFRRHYYAPHGYHYRSVYAGFFLEPLFYGAGYWLDDPYDYRLPPAEWPLRWIHYYNDALLVDVTTGEVVDIIPNFFF